MQFLSKLKKDDLVFVDSVTQQERLITPQSCVGLLVNITGLNGLRIYEVVGLMYLYDSVVMGYKPLVTCELKIIVYAVLCKAAGTELVTAQYVEEVIALLRMTPGVSFFGIPSQDPDVSLPPHEWNEP